MAFLMTSKPNARRVARLVAVVALAPVMLAAAPAAANAAISVASDHGHSSEQSSSSDGGAQADQGVVQSVSANAILLKALDGSVVSIPIDGSTRFYVGDRPASLGDIKPGFVVTAAWRDGSAAAEISALNPSPGPSVSIVASVGTGKIVVTSPDGSSTTIRVNNRTREFVDGKRARPQDVKPGYTVSTPSANSSRSGDTADELHFGKR
jgi:hypothetical protein